MIIVIQKENGKIILNHFHFHPTLLYYRLLKKAVQY